MVKRFHAIITGRVQGVFYRAMAREQASALGIHGFVRNLPDGSVELDAEGEDQSLDRFLLWCQHGPPGAWVKDMYVDWRPPNEENDTFVIS